MEPNPSPTMAARGLAYRLHRLAAVVLGLFVLAHLFNHLMALAGPEAHLTWMERLRLLYRWAPVEAVLLLAVGLQVVTGPLLWRQNWKLAASGARKWQLISGAYLQFFLLLHLAAVLSGRYLQELDTNFYFGAAGLNAFPANLFFFPYYSLAILAFFGHLASIHAQKMKRQVAGWSPHAQAWGIMGVAVVLTLLILWGMTDGFRGIEIPAAYQF